jgi:hypothetical protein
MVHGSTFFFTPPHKYPEGTADLRHVGTSDVIEEAKEENNRTPRAGLKRALLPEFLEEFGQIGFDWRSMEGGGKKILGKSTSQDIDPSWTSAPPSAPRSFT